MEALSEPDHVNVPDSSQSPTAPSVVTAVTAADVGTGSDGYDPCPLPAPAADDQLEISALDRNLIQIIDMLRSPGESVGMSPGY